jgi:hypothetical protein
MTPTTDYRLRSVPGLGKLKGAPYPHGSSRGSYGAPLRYR